MHRVKVGDGLISYYVPDDDADRLVMKALFLARWKRLVDMGIVEHRQLVWLTDFDDDDFDDDGIAFLELNLRYGDQFHRVGLRVRIGIDDRDEDIGMHVTDWIIEPRTCRWQTIFGLVTAPDMILNPAAFAERHNRPDMDFFDGE